MGRVSMERVSMERVSSERVSSERADRIQGLAAILAALAVLAGAFGAHALEGRLPPERLEWYGTAAEYQMLHAIALWFVGDLLRRGRGGVAAAALFVGGTLLFSGSLYTMALTGQKWPAPLTPLGGLGFIAGWVLLARAGGRRAPGPSS